MGGKIHEIFEVAAASVYDTFTSHPGDVGFRIPLYQRVYSWDVAHINRLYEDVIAGLLGASEAAPPVTFLGSVIVAKEHGDRESTFKGTSLSVIDGQQRLTTVSLILCRLLLHVSYRWQELDLPAGALRDWLSSEQEAVGGDLLECILGEIKARKSERTFFNHFPRLVREQADTRATQQGAAIYDSLISAYLFQVGEFYYNSEEGSFQFNHGKSEDEFNKFEERTNLIKALVENFENGIEQENIPAAPDGQQLFLEDRFRKNLFSTVRDFDESHKAIKEDIKKTDSEALSRLLRVLALSNYVLHRVGLTRVEAAETSYAFDIFEALNTSGEPLTAIETFRPQVVRYENETAEYRGSKSEKIFDYLEQHFDQYSNTERKNREAKEVILQQALYVSGRKIPLKLADQRSYLRGAFDNTKGKKEFIRSFREIVDYRHRCWSSNNIPNQEREVPEVALCLQFLKDVQKSLTVPILARYLAEAQQRKDPTIFADAVKALTAFTILRRGATGGTAGIDTDFRSLMANGPKGRLDGLESVPLCVGTGKKPNQLPDVGTLQAYLKSYLAAVINGGLSLENWRKLFVQVPIYRDGGTRLCRFLILAASHKSVPCNKNPGLITEGKLRPDNDCLNHASWKLDDFSTTEHIAPDNAAGGWEANIYDVTNLKHTIGNLSLLPKEANSAIGNTPWKKKRHFYKACAATTTEVVEEEIRAASEGGVEFTGKLKDLLMGQQALPTLSAIGAVEVWNQSMIVRRSENMADRIWSNIGPWLDLK